MSETLKNEMAPKPVRQHVPPAEQALGWQDSRPGCPMELMEPHSKADGPKARTPPCLPGGSLARTPKGEEAGKLLDGHQEPGTHCRCPQHPDPPPGVWGSLTPTPTLCWTLARPGLTHQPDPLLLLQDEEVLPLAVEGRGVQEGLQGHQAHQLRAHHREAQLLHMWVHISPGLGSSTLGKEERAPTHLGVPAQKGTHRPSHREALHPLTLASRQASS